MTQPSPEPDDGPWRVGRKQPRNLYCGDEYIEEAFQAADEDEQENR